MTHICVSKLTIIPSDNGLSPGRHQAIIWTSAGILVAGPSGTNFSEMLIEIITFSFKKMRLKVSSAKWRSCGLGLNVLNNALNENKNFEHHLTKSIHVPATIQNNTICIFNTCIYAYSSNIRCTHKKTSLTLCASRPLAKQPGRRLFRTEVQ